MEGTEQRLVVLWNLLACIDAESNSVSLQRQSVKTPNEHRLKIHPPLPQSLLNLILPIIGSSPAAKSCSGDYKGRFAGVISDL